MAQSKNNTNENKELPKRQRPRNVRNSAPAEHIDNPPKMNYTKLEVRSGAVNSESSFRADSEASLNSNFCIHVRGGTLMYTGGTLMYTECTATNGLSDQFE